MQRATLADLAEDQPWYVVQNGNQIDVGARVFPQGESAREITVASNVSAGAAEDICARHNGMLPIDNDND